VLHQQKEISPSLSKRRESKLGDDKAIV